MNQQDQGGHGLHPKVVLGAEHFDSHARAWDQNPVFVDRANQIAAGIRAAVPLRADMRACPVFLLVAAKA